MHEDLFFPRLNDLQNHQLEKCSSDEDVSEYLSLMRFPRTQAELDDLAENQNDDGKRKSIRGSPRCTCKSVLRYLYSLFPIVSVLRHYKIKEYLLKDAVSGLSTACLHFPQGMAFGILSSLAPKYGLYTSFFPVVLYVIFGTCPFVSFGTNAVISLFTANLIQSQVTTPASSGGAYSSNNTDEQISEEDFVEMKAAIAAGSSFIVGVLLLVLGLLRLGFIASYMSSPFVGAFTTTAAIHIMTSQVPKSLGVRIPLISGPGKIVITYIEIFKKITTANVGSIVTSIVCIIILIFVKDFINEKFKSKMFMPIPIDLILVILGSVVSYFGELDSQYRIPVVGNIPPGVPTPTLPDLRSGIIGNSIVIAIIVFVLTISMTKVCESKNAINADQELVAYGMSNFGSSFFSCFPSCVAPPRTILLKSMDAKTTINGIFSALVILLILLFLGEYFQYLPLPVLSIMVIMAVKNLLLQFRNLPRLWRINKYDFTVWIATLATGVFIDFPYALYCGVGLSVFLVVFQSQRGKKGLIGKLRNEDLYIGETNFTVLPPGVKVFKMESSLYFATSEFFRESLYRVAWDPRTQNPEDSNEVTLSVESIPTKGDDKTEVTLSVESTPTKGDDKTEAENTSSNERLVIIDCSSFNYVDVNGISTLSLVVKEYRYVGIKVLLIRCTDSFLSVMRRSELIETVGEENIFPDIVDAIALNISTNSTRL
ncbi:prestin-like [Saccostrea echinata]|uniref:prestin-like n=1 Tax=Saccostrea echinata TaxID=191078 RepID=UPI002A7F1423|nr:prestin-like [Saccostrea echinata]